MASCSLINNLFLKFCEQPGTIYLDGEWGLFAAQPSKVCVDEFAPESDKLLAGFYGYEMNPWSVAEPLIEKAYVGQYDWHFKKEVGQWRFYGPPEKLAELKALVPSTNNLEDNNNYFAKINVSRQEYTQNIERIKSQILAGEYFQANYTVGFDMPAPPAHKYLTLPLSPYGGFLRTEKGAIWSRSPECFVRCGNGEIITQPIKGTAKRQSCPQADRRAAESLSVSEKDRRENIMIVDLMRNDLSRVCTAESITASKICELKSYEFVHHLVSEVRGQLKCSPLAALQSCFPPGSVTGAPKRRVVECMNELEQGARGAYCGTMFYSIGDEIVSNVLIRTMTVVGDKARFNAGGAITTLSDPDDEYQEVLAKAAAFEGVF